MLQDPAGNDVGSAKFSQVASSSQNTLTLTGPILSLPILVLATNIQQKFIDIHGIMKKTTTAVGEVFVAARKNNGTAIFSENAAEIKPNLLNFDFHLQYAPNREGKLNFILLNSLCIES